MTPRLLIVLLLLPLASGDGDDDGRRGNAFYAEGQYNLAIESYERGLAALAADASPLLRYGLLNNLGAALLKSGDVEAAGEAFSRALNSAPAPADVARTAYNAGNAAFAAQDLETALQNYRESLLADPTNEDAKFNYEFAKRRLQQQQDQQQQQQGDQQNQDQQEQQEEQEQQGEQEQEEGSQNPEQQEGGSEQEQEGSPSEQEEERQGQQDSSPTDLSEEQAEQILEALQNEEEQLLREVQRPTSRPRQVEKDW